MRCWIRAPAGQTFQPHNPFKSKVQNRDEGISGLYSGAHLHCLLCLIHCSSCCIGSSSAGSSHALAHPVNRITGGSGDALLGGGGVRTGGSGGEGAEGRAGGGRGV
jgi:hypothetical protein